MAKSKPNSLKLTGKARKRAMLRMYVEGKTQAEIAAAFSISQTRVSMIANEEDWKTRLAKYWNRAYTQATTTGLKKMGSMILLVIEHQLKIINEKIAKEPGYSVPADTIRELRQMFETITKEARLNDGKPTEVTAGVVRHEVILPPGTEFWGVDAPGPNVVEVAAEVVPQIDYADGDDDLD